MKTPLLLVALLALAVPASADGLNVGGWLGACMGIVLGVWA